MTLQNGIKFVVCIGGKTGKIQPKNPNKMSALKCAKVRLSALKYNQKSFKTAPRGLQEGKRGGRGNIL
jgi:hypothetical protein